MRPSNYISIFTILFFAFNSHAQYIKHEASVFIGAVSIQTDYGQRGDFASSYANVGFGIGAAYYIGYNSGKSRWNDRTSFMQNHLRLKLEASYMSDNFVHRGEYTNSNSPEGIKYNAMQGSTKIYNFGGQMEYAIFRFDDDRKFEPYLSGGLFYVFYDPEMESALGDWKDNPSLLPNVYLNNSLHLEKDKTQAFSFGGGTRYNLDNFILNFDFRWQRFLSDNIDGLNPQLSANKYRDWLLFFNVGAVFKLN